MATLDELLSSMDDNYLLDDIQFKIDENMRTVSIPSKGVVLGVAGDKNVNHINFQMPRMYNGFDMSEFQVRINYVGPTGVANYYTVPDLTVDGDLIRFTWLVDSDACIYMGIVNFSVHMFKHQNGIITQAFNTTISTCRVLEGLEADRYLDPTEIHDILEHLKNDLDIHTETKIQQISDALPDDYEYLVEEVDALKEDLSNFKQITDNLFPSNVANWTQGMPQATTMLRRCYSKPISVQSGSTLYVYGKYIEALNADVLRIAQIDDAGNIDTSTWTTFDFSRTWKGITYTVPTGTSYIVFVLDSGSESKPVTPESVRSLKMYVGVSEITLESQWYPDVKMYTYDDLYEIFNEYSSEFSSIERKFGVYGINSSTNEFEKYGNDLYWKAREFYIRGMALKTISSSDFTTETTPSGKTGYVKIPNNSALVYNVSTESVAVIPITKLSNNIIPIFSVLLGKVVGGIGAYLYQKWELDNATSSNANLDAYWKTFLDDRMPTLHIKDIECGSNGDSFVWVTDVHVPASTLKSPTLIKYIVDNSSTSNVFCGGDILSKDTSKNAAIERLYAWQNLIRNLSPITVRGNHDANSEDNSDISLHISDKEFYSIFCKEIESSINTEKKLYYYKDNNSQKIRYIFLDTGCPDSNVIDSTQIAWMKSKISELNEGWFAIVICHQFYSGQTIASGITELPKDGNGTAIMNALDEIYDSASATIIGVISGHCHRDYVSYSAKGYPMIATTCDARQASTYDINFPERIVGTTTECAFDVFHINTMTRNIYSTRIGAGGSDGDRIFTF